MSTSLLHITNGDSTTKYLQKLKYKGDFITWREMLCEGKTTSDVGSENFWKNRFEFFKTSYKVSKRKFIDYTVKEYRNLCNHKKQDEIVLWFESDLFCQVNMLAVISWLKRFRKGHTTSLITSGKIDENEKMYGLSELSKEQLQNHFENRVILSQDDIEYADYIWQLYCSDSPLRLENVQYNPNSPFQYLTDAIKSHILRFPSIINGLNTLENSVLKAVKENEFSSKEKMVSYLLNNQENYGFGDTQYFHKINEMKKLFTTSFNPVKLSKIGKKVLYNQMNYYAQIRSNETYLGGAKKYSYLYVNTTNKLLKITS